MRPLCEMNGVEKKYPAGLVNLEEVLLCIMEKELPKNEVILEVKVDGKTYSEAYHNQAREVDLKSIEKVEILTQSPEEFARDSVREAAACLDHLERGLRTAIRFLRDPEQRTQGYDLLARSVEVLRALKSHMDQVNDLLKGEGQEPVERIFWERFEQLADRIIASQEEGKIWSIADLVEDELFPFLRAWRERIRRGT